MKVKFVVRLDRISLTILAQIQAKLRNQEKHNQCQCRSSLHTLALLTY